MTKKKLNGLHINKHGSKCWYKDGVLHREEGPAVVEPYGLESWWSDGKLHREGGPAMIDDDGMESWYHRGNVHRLDGPAVVLPNGKQRWYLDNKFLGEGVEGFWAHWKLLTPDQQNNLNLHEWLAKYYT